MLLVAEEHPTAERNLQVARILPVEQSLPPEASAVQIVEARRTTAAVLTASIG